MNQHPEAQHSDAMEAPSVSSAAGVTKCKAVLEDSFLLSVPVIIKTNSGCVSE